ncbi:hypothetical protein ACIP5Y_42355 [Nocardia sp. NPDC088792]|uniref:hypothetical protein n=1 Tax=Nocardia sp. NPDC088792 TaxID=3364332 RepID=UPI00381C68A1
MPMDRGYIENIEDRIVERAIDGLLDGMAPRPQVHFILEDQSEPHVGYALTRPYYRGTDAHTAIAGLGRAAAALCVTQIVVLWEECDLRASLVGPGDHPDSLVTVEATFDVHLLTSRPYRSVFGPPGRLGVPTVSPQWGRASQHPDARLPGPIADLLTTWRTQLTLLDPGEELRSMQASGYEFRWFVYE